MLEPHEYFEAQRWLPCKNVGATAIPPYSGVKVSGIYDDGTLQVEQADAPFDTHMGNFASTGPERIPAGEYGQATFDYPALAVTDDSTLGFCRIRTTSYSMLNPITESVQGHLYRMLGTVEVSSPALAFLTHAGG